MVEEISLRTTSHGDRCASCGDYRVVAHDGTNMWTTISNKGWHSEIFVPGRGWTMEPAIPEDIEKALCAALGINN